MKASTAITGFAIFYAIAETAYFGWNMVPATPAEAVCDGIVFLLISLAYVAQAIEKK